MGTNWNAYPSVRVVGWDFHEKVSKDAYMSLAVDFARQLFGTAVSDEQVRALLAERLDILKANGIVPHSVPKRFPRPGVTG